MHTNRLPPLNALRALAMLAITGRVGTAASNLGVTHAAVSHHLKNLEEWFGAPLVNRDGRRISLTPDGEKLALVTNQSLEKIGEVCRDIEETARRPELTLACVPSFATRWLIPKMVSFAQVAPQIRLRLLYAMHGDAPDADIIIDWRDGPLHPSVFSFATQLQSGSTRAVCSPAYLERCGPFSDPIDFHAANLLHDESRSDWRFWLQENNLPAKLADAGPVFDDFNLLVSAVVAGHGVALCAASLVEQELSRGDLILLTDKWGNRERAYWLMVKEPPDSVARIFIDWISTL